MNLKKLDNKATRTTTLAAATFGVLKAIQNSVDPYTRIAVGSVASFGILVFGGRESKYLSIGTGIGSSLQAIEISKGGRITNNQYNGIVRALTEEKGIIGLQPYEVPDGNFDGLTIAGMNGVFKLSDGVYCKIKKDGNITETLGFGKLVNVIKNAGFKDYKWCKKQADKRWLQLYNHSL